MRDKPIDRGEVQPLSPTSDEEGHGGSDGKVHAETHRVTGWLGLLSCAADTVVLNNRYVISIVLQYF
jgi:hypothetical protein